MYLLEGQVGRKYIIKNFILENKLKHRVQILGMTKFSQVKILNKNFNGALIIKLRGTRFAISSEIANSIIVDKIF